ncbi:hypothetical protein D3C71_1881430 [compost metagenome]
MQRGPDEIAAAVDGGWAIDVEAKLGRLLGEIAQAAVVLLADLKGAAVIRVAVLVGIVVYDLGVLHTGSGLIGR